MQGCSENLFYTVIIYISMVVENVKISGIAENKTKIYIYIYIYYKSNLFILLLNNNIIP